MSAPSMLGITTSGPVAAALVIGDEAWTQGTTLQALDGTLACVKAVLLAATMEIGAVGRIAVCVGPGSFTGLRIGVALAKSIAQSLDLPIVGVSAYDVAEFDAPADAYPRAAIVQGKRDFFYARIRRSPDSTYEFIADDRAEIEMKTAEKVLYPLPDLPGVEQALRTARIGRDAAALHADWRHVSIDYGQRPNAVINWEARHGIRERGDARTASKQTHE